LRPDESKKGMNTNKKIRVLVITHYSSLYGANLSMLNLLSELIGKYNIEPYVLIPEFGDIEFELQRLGIGYFKSKFYIWMHQENSSVIKYIVKTLLNPFLFFRIYYGIRKKKFDLIHSNSSTINIGGYLAKKKNCPHIWHVREFGAEDYGLHFNWGLNKAMHYMNRNSNYVIAISEAIKEKYAKYIDAGKLVVIHNGIPLDSKENQISNKIYNDDPIINVAMVGLISETKNQLEAIKGIQLIRYKHNIQNIKIHFAGTGEEKYISSLKSYIEENNLGNYVEFTGYINDIDKFLSDMDIGLVCSKMEGFGRVTIEYMLASLPVIGSNTGGTNELIKDAESGFLYNLGNVEDLAKYLKILICDAKIRTEMGVKGREIAFENFSIERTANKIYDLYSKLTT